MFRPGKNRDGYFDAKELIAQVDRTIDIFKGNVIDLTNEESSSDDEEL